MHPVPPCPQKRVRTSADPQVGPPAVTPLMIADWTNVVFVHFALPAAELAPHVPLALDVIDGRAFVSLVCFTLQGLRPGQLIPAALGRALMRPISGHHFINLRTYVRGPAGPGIHFITEWINNPISLRLGPTTYGLPYRLAEIQRADHAWGGISQVRATDPQTGAGLGIAVPFDPDARHNTCAAGTLDSFLVERYTAYTHTRGIGRHFRIMHDPWPATRVDLVRTDTTLVENLYPWFKHAELVGAHVSPGVADVQIGRPHFTRSAHAAMARELPAPALPVFHTAAGPHG